MASRNPRWRNMPDEAEISAKFIAVIQRYTNIFEYFNSKIVRSKNNEDRECQEITEKKKLDPCTK